MIKGLIEQINDSVSFEDKNECDITVIQQANRCVINWRVQWSALLND